MNTKHTPGKWFLNGLEIQSRFTQGTERSFATLARVDSSSVFTSENSIRSIAEAEANAKLIAASPCLLEALQMIESGGGITLDYATIGNICRTAITKATQP